MKICPNCEAIVNSFEAVGPVAIIHTKVYIGIDGTPSIPTSQIIKYISSDSFMDNDLLILTCPSCGVEYPVNHLKDVFMCVVTGKKLEKGEAYGTSYKGVYVSSRKYQEIVNKRTLWRN